MYTVSIHYLYKIVTITYYNPTIESIYLNNIFRILAPIFRCIPAFVVGIPVVRANFCFAWAIPSNLLSENENPYLLIICLFNLKITTYYFLFNIKLLRLIVLI